MMRPVTTLDRVLLKANSLAPIVGLRFETGFRTCLWVLMRPIFRSLLTYLLTAIGLTPGGSSTVHIYTQTVHRTTQLTILVGRLSGIRTQSGQTKINDELTA